MVSIRPREQRYVPPSPEERARWDAYAAAARAERATRDEALRPAKRDVIAFGPALRDIEAAVACGCSCHPTPASLDLHHGGASCACQQTPEERKAAWDAFVSSFDESDIEAEQTRADNLASELQNEASHLGVTAKIVAFAAPFVITGVCDGRAYYLRERHGSWMVTIASDDDPLADPWGSPLEQPTIDIATGDDADFNDCDGRFSCAVALRVAVAEVRQALLRNHCGHEDPDSDRHWYCRFCGVLLADADAYRWSP